MENLLRSRGKEKRAMGLTAQDSRLELNAPEQARRMRPAWADELFSSTELNRSRIPVSGCMREIAS